MNKIISANRGEWSEFYTLVKLLADGKVHGADENLKALEDIVYPIFQILRSEAQKPDTIYTIEETEVIIKNSTNTFKDYISRSKLKNTALNVLKSIKESENGTISIDNIEDAFKNLNCTTVKSASQNKSDITLVIHDITVNTNQTVGFSIKSQLGGNATLLNASDHTRIVYEVKGISESTAEEINQIQTKAKVLDRVKSLYDKGGSLEFEKVESDTFRKNLRRIDTAMDKITAELLKYSYISNKRTISDITIDPKFCKLLSDLDLEKEDYEFKIKNLLWASALGMSPGKVWTGYDEVYGGYLIVKEDGEIVCYHVYNQDQFKDYLLKSVYFESPSSSRHKYGSFRFTNNKIYFDLSLQIRFK